LYQIFIFVVAVVVVVVVVVAVVAVVVAVVVVVVADRISKMFVECITNDEEPFKRLPCQLIVVVVDVVVVVIVVVVSLTSNGEHSIFYCRFFCYTNYMWR